VHIAAHAHNEYSLMFKKTQDLAERSKTLLKNKEVRSLRKEIAAQFPAVTEEDVANAIVTNMAQVTITKLASKTLLYSIEGVVYFFDLNARNNLYPTVAAFELKILNVASQLL
jgi:predicted ribosome-associated RNA-binding protein Tma20